MSNLHKNTQIKIMSAKPQHLDDIFTLAQLYALSNLSQEISEINDITIQMIDCVFLDEFKKLMNSHEQVISSIIKQEPIKTVLFNDFNGSIKSLGAWGGDFILVASKENPTAYFNNKGFETILRYSEMVLSD